MRCRWEIEEGAIVAIVGANGAGKTTSIRSLAGMLPQARGRVVFRDTDISHWPSHRICDLGLGQVAEGRQVFPTLSVAENLDIGGMLPRARAQRVRNRERVLSMFPVLAERSRQPAGTLSGGEQQMLAIGRCLMGAPQLIMFDEPSLGLAPGPNPNHLPSPDIVSNCFQSVVYSSVSLSYFNSVNVAELGVAIRFTLSDKSPLN